MVFNMYITKNHPILIILLRSVSFSAKEWINIDHNEVKYNKTVVDFILGLHDVFESAQVCC